MMGQDRVRLAQGIGALARPGISGRVRHHAGAYRIELDIPLAAQHIGLGLETPRRDKAKR
jgi:hypothetical protein